MNRSREDVLDHAHFGSEYRRLVESFATTASIPDLRAEYQPMPHRPPELAQVDGSLLRQPPGYAYDYHTAVGRNRIERWKVENPNQELRVGVDTGDIDLRWAGGLMTLFWRFEAFRQAGSMAGMDRLRWSDVPRSDRWIRPCSWNTDWH